ncbi:Fc receptor-like A isoform X2 [Tupaia chinensis]|uniref:Fc receptor-like A isoform X2 n=1 Tax=Tupaia chinensis TaxID=246437 RepID=UPI000FFCA84F|nr:Fc receptor-like A isoform X2 [Tupaia chinensis]
MVTVQQGCELMALYLPLAVFWVVQTSPAACHTAAGFLQMQCEAAARAEEHSCHSADAGAGASEADFRSYSFSQPFHLIVSYDWLILQGPAKPVFEGDPVVLHCRAWQDWPLTQVTFYRDGSALGPTGPSRDFSIAAVQEADSGNYHCSGVFRSPGSGSLETASAVAITVQELFPAPVLRATPSAELQEGSPVTLTCQTKLPLQRSAARLLFSFYKDGRMMRSKGLSAEFQLPTVSEAHSGSYWCEAATEDNQVWKQSPQLELRVQSPSSSAAPPTLNPPQPKSAAPDTAPTEPLESRPPLPTPSAVDPGFSPLAVPDPHLHHQMNTLLKHMQDVRALLGHLLMELRELSGRLKTGPAKSQAQ